MNPDPILTSRDTYLSRLHHHCSSLSWGAILGGLTATLAFQVLFIMLGAGLGFAAYNPITSENPIENLGAGAVVVQGVSAVFSLWFGGWIAGRFTPITARASGALHGFLVWCAGTVAGVLVVSIGAGWAVGGVSKIVGDGLSALGKPAAAAVSGTADVAKDAVKQSDTPLSSYVDEAVATRPADRTAIRAKREIGLAVARLFNPMQTAHTADNKAAVVQALVASGQSQADAERLVDEWTASYERVKADLAAAKQQAEEKARVAAEEAAKHLALYSLVAFFAFLLGAAAAACGGNQGAKAAFKHDYRGEVPV